MHRKIKDKISESEYVQGNRKIIAKLKNSQKHDVLEEVKQKVEKITERFEDRIEIEEKKVEQIQKIGNYLV